MTLTPPETIAADAQSLAQRVRSLVLERGTRILLGISGTPGAGKSTLADELVSILGHDTAIVVPMDGFHLATDIIRSTPLIERRGAIDTFDVGSYLSLLRRLRQRDEETVYAPTYRRGLEDPIAASVAIPRSVPVVITEGNYLLADDPQWKAVHHELDAVWYLDTPSSVRLPRLIKRHVEFGRDETDAEAWALGSDQANAHFIESRRHAADLIITLTD